MGYLVWAVVIAIAVVLFIFTGIWGGLIWIVVAGGVLAVVFMGSARTFRRARTEPTGVTRSGTGGGTANERVGQS
jgi:D-alanyl-lipoteichoic acid acyltransferase DltB (MBOAT superfamily)